MSEVVRDQRETEECTARGFATAEGPELPMKTVDV